MGYIVLTVLGFFVIFALMTYGATILASKYVTRVLDARLTDLEQLVNEQREPDAWVQPFRKKLTTARATGESKLKQLGEKTHWRCMRKLEEMIRYTTEVNFADSEETRQTVVSTLKRLRDQWEIRDWRAWIDVLGAPVPLPETTDEGLSPE